LNMGGIKGKPNGGREARIKARGRGGHPNPQHWEGNGAPSAPGAKPKGKKK
jgi:hypothetical protein